MGQWPKYKGEKYKKKTGVNLCKFQLGNSFLKHTNVTGNKRKKLTGLNQNLKLLCFKKTLSKVEKKLKR